MTSWLASIQFYLSFYYYIILTQNYCKTLEAHLPIVDSQAKMDKLRQFEPNMECMYTAQMQLYDHEFLIKSSYKKNRIQMSAGIVIDRLIWIFVIQFGRTVPRKDTMDNGSGVR